MSFGCVSGQTIGAYSFTDCCGLLRKGISFGESVCLDEGFTGSSVGVYIASGTSCTQNCNPSSLNYTFSVTGLCGNPTGTVDFFPNGGTQPYTISDITPGILSAQTGTGTITFTGLTGGTYVFRLNDSSGGQNADLYINVYVGDCYNADIVDVTGTTCGQSNGYLSVSAITSGCPYTVVLYKDGSVYDTQVATLMPYEFYSLPSGVYYAQLYDSSMATASTGNVVVVTSTTINFGFWKVNTSNCVIDKGKLSVTGVTGTGPYTYLWSNGETGQTITGLTQGVYSCTVTDANGCSQTLSDVIGVADPLGIGLLSASTPSCFSSDGSLTYFLTGGTAPFYFSATTGQVGYTLSNQFTLTNLAAGSYLVNVRDANFCEVTLPGFLSPVNGFQVVDTIVTNSDCNQNNGEIYVEIQGLGGFYTFILSGQNTNTIYQNTSLNQTQTFTSLANDTYELIITGSGTNCVYNTFLTVSSEQKFPVLVNVSAATCGGNDGVVTVEVGSGYTGNLDYVLSNGSTNLNTTSTAITYNNLVAGTYTVTVTDDDGCSVSSVFTINTAGQLITSVVTTNCVNGNDGSAQVIVYNGEPTFTYNWSDGSTGSSISNLSSGNYYVEITDSNGCYNIQYFTINCVGTPVSSYQLFNLCTDTFTTTVGTKRGLFEMLNEGFIDITSGITNCTLSSATFTCEIEFDCPTTGDTTYSVPFYTATTLNDVPQDSLWQQTIESILSSATTINSYTVDLLNNTLQIISNCNGDYDPLSDCKFYLRLKIEYVISCNDCGTNFILTEDSFYITTEDGFQLVYA
jgi:hypothetical protein